MAWRRSSNWWNLTLIGKFGIFFLAIALVSVSAKESLEPQSSSSQKYGKEVESNYLIRTEKSHTGGVLRYKHVWPIFLWCGCLVIIGIVPYIGIGIRFGWKVVVGTLLGFFGAAFGSVGGVGGGGFYVPMLTLIIGFDQKSSTAISKCMITAGAVATVLYNLRLRHPTLELPLIDYDLALLFQPMLILGISIGVSLNVVLPEWLITILVIVVLLGTSIKSIFKGVDTWKKETKTKKVIFQNIYWFIFFLHYLIHPILDLVSLVLGFTGCFQMLGITRTDTPSGARNNPTETNQAKREVSVLENVYWKQLGIIASEWLIILGLQIAKNYVTICSAAYWSLDLLQIPVVVGPSSYQAIKLYQGQRVVGSQGSETGANWTIYKLVFYCASGIAAGIVAGLLGLGGGFIMGPLFLEMGIPPQVSSATATFIMTFSSSMSVVEYYLLKRFPIPYALYFAGVATVSAILGQHVGQKVIKALGRASLIIFILAFTAFASALSLGGVGLAHLVTKIQHKEYLGFENMCTHKS